MVGTRSAATRTTGSQRRVTAIPQGKGVKYSKLLASNDSKVLATNATTAGQRGSSSPVANRRSSSSGILVICSSRLVCSAAGRAQFSCARKCPSYPWLYFNQHTYLSHSNSAGGFPGTTSSSPSLLLDVWSRLFCEP